MEYWLYVAGRAWLYLALTDHLLESYLRCFITNQASIRHFYAKEALVLDQQRMEILLTVAAGLEFITFQLDVVSSFLIASVLGKPDWLDGWVTGSSWCDWAWGKWCIHGHL